MFGAIKLFTVFHAICVEAFAIALLAHKGNEA